MKQTLFASILIFAFTLISISAVQIYNGSERFWVRESEEFYKLVNKLSWGIAFCYSGDSNTTCWAVTDDGWYMTAGHKVNRDFPQSQTIYVKLDRKRDAKVFVAEKIIQPPENQDLLLFKIDYKPKYYFKNFKEPFMLEENWVFGFRGSSGKVLSSPGYVTRDVKFPSLVRTTARTAFGQSGGPVINRKGQVLGVAILISIDSFGDNFFIPASEVQKYIKENLKKNGS